MRSPALGILLVAQVLDLFQLGKALIQQDHGPHRPFGMDSRVRLKLRGLRREVPVANLQLLVEVRIQRLDHRPDGTAELALVASLPVVATRYEFRVVFLQVEKGEFSLLDRGLSDEILFFTREDKEDAPRFLAQPCLTVRPKAAGVGVVPFVEAVELQTFRIGGLGTAIDLQPVVEPSSGSFQLIRAYG